MNSDRDDPVLDACLDEVLGGQTPPDLSERIMRAWSARNGNAAALPLEHPIEAPPVLAGLKHAVQPPPINGHPVVELAAAPASSRGVGQPTAGRWPFMAIAIGTIGLVLMVGVAVLNWNRRPQIATVPVAGDHQQPNPVVAQTSPEVPPAKREAVPPRRVLTPRRGNDAPQVTIAPAPSVAPVEEPRASDSPAAPQVAASEPAQPEPAGPEKPYYRPEADSQIVSFVNAELARTWNEVGVKPAAPATDAEWCRRLYVRVLGRTPTAEELTSFTKQKGADRRAKLVERLLTESEYVAEYASNWAGIWANILIGRTGGGRNSLASRDDLEKYLRVALAENKPYDKVVSELLTATGSAKPGADDYNPAVNFLLDGFDSQATLATARVARVFLGSQLQCAQCHAHPTHDWSQEQYWALNSFFRQMKAERGDVAKLTNVDFGGQGRNSRAGEVFYETPAGLLKSAFPKFVDGTAIPASGQLADVDRRAELARLVVHSDQLPRALVNRVWSHFFGYGFTRPTEDVNASPSHPAVLARLAEQFAAHNYDLKSMIRWVALSDSFARSSKMTDLATKDLPEAGEVALFSRYYLRQMQPEEVYSSLVHAAQIRKTTANSSELEKARVDWLAQFNRSMGTDDGQEESHFSGGVRQSLMMMNGDLVRKAVSSQQGGILKTLGTSDMKFDQKVEHLFLSALSRQPTARELRVATTILTGSKGNEAAALEDIWWAILNSNEFILDH